MPEPQYDEGRRRIYQPDGVKLRAFLRDRSPVAVIRGPIGSGTSTGCCFRIFAHAMEQNRNPVDGVQRSRWAIIRSTYPQLQTSTLRTWLKWFPEERYGRLNRARPMHQVIRLGTVELEVWFLALDLDDDVEKLRSTEFTGMWFNEVEYFSYLLLFEGYSRCGRFPAVDEGGTRWKGVIGDMNAPNEEHWLPRMTGEVDWPDDVPSDKRVPWPAEWAYFVQDPGLIEVKSSDGKTVTGYVENPKAENLQWLTPGYYLDLAKGAQRNWIDSRIMNRITFVVEGDPVWPGVKQELVFSPGPLEYVPGREVIVSLDFGRRPTALIAQEMGDKVQCQREFRMYGVGAATFAPALKRFLEQHYRGAKVRFTGDPKGRDKGQADERSAYDIFASFGMHVTPAPVRNNNLDDRLEAVAFALQTNRLWVSPECPTLRAALAGKYHLRKLELGEAEPVKDKYSDVADCLQYLALFLGEGRRMIGLDAVAAARPVKVFGKPKSLRRVS